MTLDDFLKVPVVKNVCIGRCVTGRRLNGEKAHAHHDPVDDYAGWICVRSPRAILKVGSSQVSKLMLHELAHLVSEHGHDDVWRTVMGELGQKITLQYQKRARRTT